MSASRWIQYVEDAVTSLLESPEPASDSVSSTIWNECQDIANNALNSDFMQGLGKGTLNPDKYGQYTVQDCAYCVAAADDYKQLEQLAAAEIELTLAAFARSHYTSHEKWVKDTYLPAWHIGNPDSLVLNEAGRQYIAHERLAITTLHPIYGVIAQIPCERLWSWLAKQLQPGSPDDNVYNFWITSNAGYKHSYLLSNYIDKWFKENPTQYDHDVALTVLRGSMIGELNMFRAACGQSLTSMPTLPSS